MSPGSFQRSRPDRRQNRARGLVCSRVVCFTVNVRGMCLKRSLSLYLVHAGTAACGRATPRFHNKPTSLHRWVHAKCPPLTCNARGSGLSLRCSSAERHAPAGCVSRYVCLWRVASGCHVSECVKALSSGRPRLVSRQHHRIGAHGVLTPPSVCGALLVLCCTCVAS